MKRYLAHLLLGAIGGALGVIAAGLGCTVLDRRHVAQRTGIVMHGNEFQTTARKFLRRSS